MNNGPRSSPFWRLGPGTSWKVAIGLVLGTVLLAVAARGVGLGQIGAGLAGADPCWVVLALLLVLLTTAGKIGRWRLLFPRGQRPGLLLLGEALLVGQMTNALLPARVGDVARAYLASTDGETSGAMALGSVAAEKAFDVLFLLVAVALSAVANPLPPWVDWTLSVLAGAGVLVMLATVAWSECVLAWASRWVSRRLGTLGDWGLGVVRRVVSGLQSLRDVRMVLLACVWSAAVWSLAAGTNYLLFLAFRLPLSFGAALLLLVILHVGVAPPSSPGKLGVFHALVVLSLESLGIGRSSALVYGAVLHAIVYGPQIVLGALSFALVRWRGRRAL